MHANGVRLEALALVAQGLTDREVSRRTGVPRSTVGAWRRRPERSRRRREAVAGWRPPDQPAYCYLLGLYLGDGHIVVRGRSARVCLSLDALYPRLIAAAAGALGETFPEARVRTYRDANARRVDLRLNDPSLPQAFPQHGLGRKHERPIRLRPWQAELTEAYPERLIRGLIHSDGCRSVNRFRTQLPSGRIATYEYPRYFFSNLSADIRAIFCRHCDLLGLRWTQSNHRNISIAHRDSVALMEQVVGPKS